MIYPKNRRDCSTCKWIEKQTRENSKYVFYTCERDGQRTYKRYSHCPFHQYKDEELKPMAVEKKGVVWDDEFIKFDDGTFLDFRDPTLNNRPAFVLPKNGEKVKVIVVKED